MAGPVLAQEAASNSATLASPLASKFGVHEWFAIYDQIRRDAEMTLGEKLQTKTALEKGLNTGKKSEKKNGAVPLRVISKYTGAVSALQKLQVLPETSELQAGYTQYFTKMRQLFLDSSQTGNTPAAKHTFSLAAKELQELDKKNKKLDEELRKKYAIPKHKHS